MIQIAILRVPKTILKYHTRSLLRAEMVIKLKVIPDILLNVFKWLFNRLLKKVHLMHLYTYA